jgi:hypothetical protein
VWRGVTDGLVGVLLLALLLLFFWTPVFEGQILGAADIVYTTPFFAARAPAGFEAPRNELLFDAAYQFMPWRHFACASLGDGELPLWNPYSAAGTPFVATMQSAVFYPPNLVLCALPLGPSLVWSAVLRLWIAGFFTYALARLYGLGLAAALVAGISFMFSGFLVVWLEHPHTNVAVWLPALILLAEMLLRAVTRAGSLVRAAALAAVVGVLVTGGHVETVVNVLFVLAVYAVVRTLQLGVPLSRLALVAAAVALGLGLAGVQLVPFLEWLPLSAELRRRTGTVLPLFDMGWWRRALALPLAVFPNLYNNPSWPGPDRSFLPWGNFNEDVLYVGTVPLLLGLIGMVAGGRGTAARCWTFLAMLTLGMALRLPLFDWLNRLPGLHLALPGRLRLISAFGLSVLAGFGLAALQDAARPERPALLWRWRQASAAVVMAGVVLALAGTFVLPRLEARIAASARAVAEQKYAALAHPVQPLAYYQDEADRMVEALVSAFRADNFAMYAPVAWALAGLALAAVRHPWAAGALVAVVAADLIHFGRGYHPTVAPKDFYPSTWATARIAADPGLQRFTALGEDLIPDTHMMYRLSDVRGLDHRTAWYDDYLSLLPERRPWITYGVLLESVTSPLLRVLNLKYVATARGAELGKDASIRILDQRNGLALGELRQVQPRSFMVYEHQPVASDAEAFAALRAAPEAVGSRVVLVVPPGEPAPEPAAKPATKPEVTLLTYAPRLSSWRVRTAADGFLVTTDAFYPGWTVALDDRPARLFRANGAFRAVHLPAGEHVVTYRYAPWSMRLGLATTLACALMIVGMVVSGTRSR